jgi:hypothetical protein
MPALKRSMIYNLSIEAGKEIPGNRTLTEFEEIETEEETNIIGNMAQRFSKYHKSGYLNGTHFQ